MKVRYILMYGTPYLKHEHFETFEDISKFLVRKSIVDYRIYEIMDDAKEVEMIHLENDVKVLEKENKDMKRTIELFSNSLYNADLKRYKSTLEEIREYIMKNIENNAGEGTLFIGEVADLLQIIDRVKESDVK